jgi:hypothetical protein
VEVELVAGAEFTAALHVAPGSENKLGLWMLDYEKTGWTSIASSTVVGSSRLLTFTPESSGTYELRVYAWEGAVPYRLEVFQTFPVPTLLSIDPSTGPVGTAVTITGSGFASTQSVSFNGVPSAFTVVSDVVVTTLVPVGATSGDVTITTAGGSVTHVEPFEVVRGRTLGDYDGDGVTDVAVFRPSNGRWYVLGRPAVSWGLSGDVPVPGDYDGDGVTDVAVFRPSNGRWYVLGMPAVSWGVSGDLPV